MVSRYTSLFKHGGDVLEVVIRDEAGNKIDVRRCNLADKDEVSRIFRWLKEKYNMELTEQGWLDFDNDFFKI